MSNESTVLTTELIQWAYRLLLARDPESGAAVDDKLTRLSSPEELLSELFNSEEFCRRGVLQPQLPLEGDEPPMSIQLHVDRAKIESLYGHVARNWEALGLSEPHWSVVSADQFRSECIAGNIVSFFASGEDDVDTLLAVLLRNAIDVRGFRHCLEFGCGLGRVTRWLGPHFESVCAVDISAPHLAAADEYIRTQGLSNVEFRHVSKPEEVNDLPETDLIYSVMVLQHNPPPVIGFILRNLLKKLRPGGAAVFQVPTYKQGYEFEVSAYLESQEDGACIEMHVFPQGAVFALAKELGIDVLEVMEDAWAGLEHGHRSNTFVLRRPVD